MNLENLKEKIDLTSQLEDVDKKLKKVITARLDQYLDAFQSVFENILNENELKVKKRIDSESDKIVSSIQGLYGDKVLVSMEITKSDNYRDKRKISIIFQNNKKNINQYFVFNGIHENLSFKSTGDEIKDLKRKLQIEETIFENVKIGNLLVLLEDESGIIETESYKKYFESILLFR
jgi:hypothetical protein